MQDRCDAEEYTHLLKMASLLSARLERLSADSTWAHRASGLRGSLLRATQAQLPNQEYHTPTTEEYNLLALLVRQGFFILEHAAREMHIPSNEP